MAETDSSGRMEALPQVQVPSAQGSKCWARAACCRLNLRGTLNTVT